MMNGNDKEKRIRRVLWKVSLQPTGEEDEIEASMKIKENPSGYMVQVYNIGLTPFY